MTPLWEILVPATYQLRDEVMHTHARTVEYPLAHHKKWDAMVREIAGGLTVYRSAHGEWVSPTREVFTEKMIPVRVACTEAQLQEILKITVEHYEQEAVMAYKIAAEVVMYEKEDR